MLGIDEKIILNKIKYSFNHRYHRLSKSRTVGLTGTIRNWAYRGILRDRISWLFLVLRLSLAVFPLRFVRVPPDPRGSLLLLDLARDVLLDVLHAHLGASLQRQHRAPLLGALGDPVHLLGLEVELHSK